MEVTICPLPEQRAIVSKIEQLFSELENGIANLKLAKEQLKVYRQAVLKKAFEGELTKKWREQQTDLPDAGGLLEQIRKEKEKAAKKAGKKLKQVKPFTEDELEDLNRLPKEWNWVKIGNLTLGVEYGTSAKSKESGDVAVLRMGNIQNGRFDWSDLVYTSDKTEIEKYLLSKDDVLFNRTNSPELVGKTAIYKGEKPAIFAGYLIRINQLSELAVADYLNYFLNCHIAKVHGNSVKTDGVNQSNINGEKLGNYPFPLCSLPEQQTIVQEIETRLSICDKIEQDIETNLEKAEALRQSILKKAFEGKLLNERELAEVRGAEDWEPAEVLLERIKAEKAQNGKK
ncbi:Type I restriction-modification system, specificity subunit S [Methanosarcina mazei WWM610]|uniref:Type I restriction-modification system, specificity subunit S n=2 Tax=Methanosarcina mazei TaxID=2209 RepID=A0A0E3Q0L4_METMZ|nr:Type I restriction-modification system, specificity subunit S [Methanosarcina mazei WWM610]AKB66199.1 Type I restriction-modification system, specificity subunit S [Methanosarcina mazei S-6]